VAVTLLDAHALIDFLTGGPAVDTVTKLLRTGDCAATTVNIAETCDVSARRYGIPTDRVMELLEPLLGGVIAIVALELSTAIRAGTLRAQRYSRATRPLSLADAILLASARPGDRIATADPLVLDVAHELGIARLPLPMLVS